MYNVKITISGPGLCINKELYYIEKCLLDAGYYVNVENEHPIDLNKLKKSVVRESKIKIIMDHMPWGG